MPYLYCKTHGTESEAGELGNEEMYRQDGESVLVIKGKLSSGPWRCDSCNALLNPGDEAVLTSAFPAHCRQSLYDYDFSYERDYFAMAPGDKAVVYGAAWPDDSIRKRRQASGEAIGSREEPLCALDLFPDGCP